MSEAWILDVVRTPRGKGRADGALHGIHPQALFSQCLHALAARTGFATPSAFVRAFRRWTGTTPSAYRQAEAGSPA